MSRTAASAVARRLRNERPDHLGKGRTRSNIVSWHGKTKLPIEIGDMLTIKERRRNALFSVIEVYPNGDFDIAAED